MSQKLMLRDPCGHRKCRGNSYCYIESYARAFVEHSKMLEKAVDPETKCWKDTCHVYKPVRLQFLGIEVFLNPDGTYDLGDTTGG